MLVCSVPAHMTSILLVDPDLAKVTALAEALVQANQNPSAGEDRVHVVAVTDFFAARAQLRLRPPALLVTALKLGEYNGLNLVYVAAASGQPIRSVVYTETVDPVDAREVRAAGAFYETRSHLSTSMSGYASAALPPKDRRVAVFGDRRQVPRGGRRTLQRSTRTPLVH
jgi:CheY-like chemotaxis protein